MNYSYEEIRIIIAEFLSVWKKSGCYEEEANHSQRILTLFQNSIFSFFLLFMT